MKTVFVLMASFLMTSISYGKVSYMVENTAVNTCDCASTQATDAYKIKPGYCIFSLCGEITNVSQRLFWKDTSQQRVRKSSILKKIADMIWVRFALFTMMVNQSPSLQKS